MFDEDNDEIEFRRGNGEHGRQIPLASIDTISYGGHRGTHCSPHFVVYTPTGRV